MTIAVVAAWGGFFLGFLTCSLFVMLDGDDDDDSEGQGR